MLVRVDPGVRDHDAAQARAHGRGEQRGEVAQAERFGAGLAGCEARGQEDDVAGGVEVEGRAGRGGGEVEELAALVGDGEGAGLARGVEVGREGRDVADFWGGGEVRVAVELEEVGAWGGGGEEPDVGAE